MITVGDALALKQTMLSAASIVYNTASSGLYLEKLFERIGIAEQIRAKATRYPNGEEVMDHIIKGKGNELGFGAITEIKSPPIMVSSLKSSLFRWSVGQ